MDENLFEYKGKKYRVIPVEETHLGCMECCFFSFGEKCGVFPRCTSKYQKEERIVIFEEIEENKMEKRMFEDIRVGDKVFTRQFGWMEVEKVYENEFQTILIRKGHSPRYLWFYKTGMHTEEDVLPSVFWEKPKLEYIKERPFSLENELRKLRIKEFVPKDDNYSLEYDFSTNAITIDYRFSSISPNAFFFEKKDLDDLCKTISNIEISFKEFETAYKKVFLEEK